MAKLAVLFDMDGLMLDTERVARLAWTRALQEKGYRLEEKDYLPLLGRTRTDARQILSELFGPDLPYDQVFAQRQVYYEAEIEANGIVLKPGLLDLLDFLEARLISKAVASSTPRWFVDHKLTKAGIVQRFKAIVGGDMVPHGKPCPDLFLEAARRIEALPQNCLALEDSEAGIRAAHSAGMLPVMIPDLLQPSVEVQTLTFRVLPSLLDVIPLIQGLIDPEDAQ